MKSILLTSTALIALGGAAFAEAHEEMGGVSFGGGASLEYNTNDDGDDEGFSWDADLSVTFEQTLNGGLVARAEFEAEVADDNLGQDVVSESYLLTLESDLATLQFGDTDPAAESMFDDVDGMEFAGFNDRDVHLNDPTDDDAGVSFDAILRGDVNYAGFTAGISYGVEVDGDNAAGVAAGEVDALQVGVMGTFGNFSMTAGYQDEFAGADAVFGVSAATSFAGADIKVAYGDDGTETSTGIDVAYPIGPVVIGGYYTMNDVAEDNYGVRADYATGAIAVSAFYDVDGGEGGADDTEDYGIEGSYDLMNGLVVYAGAVDSFDDYYVAAEYDLGGGAEAFVSYVDDGGDLNGDNEIGENDYARGTTIGVSFSF